MLLKRATSCSIASSTSRPLAPRASIVARAASSNQPPSFNMASSPCCAAGKPVHHDHKAQGTFTKIGDMDAYITGSGPAAIIVIYDIFGFKFNQVLQVCDRLAEAGFTVAAPDVFRGKPWSMERFPPKPADHFMDWIHKEGAFPKIHADVKTTLQYLRSSKGVTGKVGTLGFCWGAAMSIQCGADPDVSACACAHPAFFGQDKDFAAKLAVPVCILPAKGDPMESIRDAVAHKPFASKCVYQRFDDQEHGFVAARGDWAQPAIAAAATKAIGIFTDFFKANLL